MRKFKHFYVFGFLLAKFWVLISKMRVLISKMTKTLNDRKIPEKGNFGSKLRRFFFFFFFFLVRFYNYTNSRVLNSNIKLSLKILPNRYPNQVFLVSNLSIFGYFAKFSNYTNWRVLISILTNFLKHSGG